MTTKFAKITDEMLEKARRRIGVEKPVRNQVWEVASRDALRHFAFANGDLNPLWTDQAYAQASSWGTQLAPPHFPMVDHMTPLYPMEQMDRKSKGEGFPGIMAMISLWEFTFQNPIRVGDTLKTVEKTVGIVDPLKRVDGDLIEPSADFAKALEAADMRRGAFDGRMADQIQKYTTYASGKEAASCLLHYARVERGIVTPEQGKFRDLELPKYSEEDLSQISLGYENEFRRGSGRLRWDDIKIGDTLPSVVKGPLTILDMCVLSLIHI